LHTALDSLTADEGAIVGGPDIAGKKATAVCGSWVGDLIHAQDFLVPRTERVPDAETGELKDAVTYDTRARYYFRRHPDPRSGVVYGAGSRCPPERIAELDKKFPGGFFEPTAGERPAGGGIDRYLHAIDELTADAAKGTSLVGWRERTDARLRGTPIADSPKSPESTKGSE
jgi:hypothetical protein